MSDNTDTDEHGPEPDDEVVPADALKVTDGRVTLPRHVSRRDDVDVGDEVTIFVERADGGDVHRATHVPIQSRYRVTIWARLRELLDIDDGDHVDVYLLVGDDDGE